MSPDFPLLGAKSAGGQIHWQYMEEVSQGDIVEVSSFEQDVHVLCHFDNLGVE